MQPDSSRVVSSLHVIYDADGTRTGEMVYIVKKLLGLGHCAACDITHGPHREKPEFTQLKSSWPVPVHNIHRDEMDAAMSAAVGGVFPCVMARTDGGDVMVMGPRELEGCGGDVVEWRLRLRECVEGKGLVMGEGEDAEVFERFGEMERRKPKGIEEAASESSSEEDAVVPSGEAF